MTFDEYLARSRAIAEEETEILDTIRSYPLDRITTRAAKNSLQVLIENSIGKAKKILQHYDCTIIPHESRDAVQILADCGAIDEEMRAALLSAIGFRNVMIHDYMNFNPEILKRILETRNYEALYRFLIDECRYSETIRKRIANYEM